MRSNYYHGVVFAETLYFGCLATSFFNNNVCFFFLASKAQILSYFDTKPKDEEKLPPKKSGIQSLPETDAYIHLLCCIFFIDNGNNEKVFI